MIYVIAYDIESDHIRDKISKLLEENGTRVQKSVFECKLEYGTFRTLFESLAEEKIGDGNIRIYPICENCYKKAIGIGEIQQIPGSKGYEIV